MGLLDKLFGKDDDKKEEGMTPEQVAAMNRKGLIDAMTMLPPITMGQMMNGQQTMSNRQALTGAEFFNQLFGLGQAMNNTNPNGPKVETINPGIDTQAVADSLPETTPVDEPPPTPDNGWGAVKTNQDAIAWSLANGDITQDEADWLNRWSGDSGHKGDMFVTGGGGFRDWNIGGSDLDGRNKGIVTKFRNSISGNYAPRNGGGPMEATPTVQQPSTPVAGVMPMPNMQGGGYVNNSFMSAPTPRGRRGTV